MQKIDLKRVGVLLLGAIVPVSMVHAQDRKPVVVNPDTTLLNDVQIDSEPPLRRSTPDLSLLEEDPNGDATAVPSKSNGRWIGVGIGPVPPALRSHLKIDDGVGLVVEQVVPGGPAEKAGLRHYDIITSVNGVPITDPTTLVSAVRDAKEAPLTLTWRRGTEKMLGTVTPVERPAWMRSHNAQQSLGVDSEDLGRLRDWLSRLEEDAATGNGGNFGTPFGPMRMRVAPHGLSSSSNQQVFQKNIQIQIQRNNDEPAKIKIQKDGDSWELTEDDLDQLPNDVRSQVESMLGSGMPIGGEGFQTLPGHLFDGLPDMQRAIENLDGALRGAGGFDHQFDEMNRQMEQILDQMKQIRSQQKLLIPAEDLEDAEEA